MLAQTPQSGSNQEHCTLVVMLEILNNTKNEMLEVHNFDSFPQQWLPVAERGLPVVDVAGVSARKVVRPPVGHILLRDHTVPADRQGESQPSVS